MADRQQRTFEKAILEVLQERSRITLAGNQRVLELLKAAQGEVLALLATQPADWQQMQLSQVKAQLEAIISGATNAAGTAAAATLSSAWALGDDLVDKPLAAIGTRLDALLPQQDVRLLAAMNTFVDGRFQNVGSATTGAIDNSLALVLIGAQTPQQAMQQVQKALGDDTRHRASTIVVTESHRAFASASDQRLQQAAAVVPGLKKQWRRSGKIHSRWRHDIMDGQIVDTDKPFRISNPKGGIDLMMHPHDPKAPAGQVINCGCIAIPWMEDWTVQTPGARPFSAEEVAQNPAKKALDRGAKKAGLRPEPLPNIDKAVMSSGKIEGYALNPNHPVGGNKAKVLKAALGFDKDNADDFRQALRAALPTAVARLKMHNNRGYQLYTVDVVVENAGKRRILRSGWRIGHNDTSRTPQLTTVYVRDKPRTVKK